MLIMVLSPYRNPRPVVCAERAGRKTGLVVEIADRIARPCVPYSQWILHFRAGNNHVAAVYPGIGEMEHMVAAFAGWNL